jgi:aminoacyl tRNA synthase complex-interacting multifunctional protein 1
MTAGTGRADRQVSAPATQHPSQPSILRYFLQIQTLQSVQSAQSKNPNSYPALDIDVSTLAIPERKVIVPPKKEKKDKKPVAAEGTAAGSIVGAVTGAVAAAGSAVGSAAEAVKNAVVGEGEAAAPKEGGRKDKKEKKEKKEKPKVEAKVETGPMPSMIDMRVGKVLDGMSSCSNSKSELIV